jgi:transcriptional regulator GlxA family with amidase domain
VEPLVDAVSPASRNRLEAARRYIDEHLTSDSLTVESVQAWLGVSRRQLYAFFEPYGGVARYILRQRLRRLHAFLAQSDVKRSVASVAEQFGIDPCRVQRLFREEFGYGPEEVRSKGVARPFEVKSDAVYESRVA